MCLVFTSFLNPTVRIALGGFASQAPFLEMRVKFHETHFAIADPATVCCRYWEGDIQLRPQRSTAIGREVGALSDEGSFEVPRSMFDAALRAHCLKWEM